MKPDGVVGDAADAGPAIVPVCQPGPGYVPVSADAGAAARGAAAVVAPVFCADTSGAGCAAGTSACAVMPAA